VQRKIDKVLVLAKSGFSSCSSLQSMSLYRLEKVYFAFSFLVIDSFELFECLLLLSYVELEH